MKKAMQPVSVDGIEFDALIGSTESYDANVPEYSVETGFSVSDTIILNPETLDLTLFVSNRPVTWANRFGASGDRVDSVIKQLKELYMSKKLITVTTSGDTYANMAITSLTITKSNALGYAREVPIKLKKVRVTETKTTSIPAGYGKSGASGASAGTASTSKGYGSAGGTKPNAGGAAGSSASGNGSASGAGSPPGPTANSGSKKSGSILYNVATGVGLLK